MKNKKIISTILMFTMAAYTTIPVFATSKSETVYSNLNVNGENYKTIVSTKLSNEENLQQITDITNLIDILNTNGDETYIKQSENQIIWNSNGENIYYQGESKETLPVECKIKYEIDGKEISAKDIQGKAGKIKISIEYTNNEKHLVTVNGKEVTMYTPFIVIAGTKIDNTQNKNIEITNGKVIDNGTDTIVAGVAMPGMQESLGISKDKIEIPDKIEINMETENFKMGNIIAIVSAKGSDTDFSNKLNSIYSSINELSEASSQILEGSTKLTEGTQEYSEKSQEFNDSMKLISSGVSTINYNYNKIDKGISSLNNGSKNLSSGINQLNSGAKDLSNGSSELITGVSDAKNKTTQALNESSEELATGIQDVATQITTAIVGEQDTSIVNIVKGANSKLKQALKTNITSAANATAQSQVSASLQNSLESSLTKSLKAELKDSGLTDEQIENIAKTSAKNASIEAAKNSIDVGTSVSQVVNTAVDSSVEGQISGIKQVAQSIGEAFNELKLQISDKLSAGAQQISGGFDKILNGSNELKQNIDNKLISGTEELSDGAKELSQGTDTLSAGSSELKNGLNTADSSTKQLTQANNMLAEGAKTLNEGAITLEEGIKTFNEEGISKLYKLINGDLKDLATRAQKLNELANEYNTFSGKSEEAQGEVKFIMIVDGIDNKIEKEEVVTTYEKDE